MKTGLPGPPSEPFIISTAVVGFHDEHGPDLRPATHSLRARMEGLRRTHRENEWVNWDRWGLIRVTPDWRRRSFNYPDGRVPDGVWNESVDGIPERFDTVILESSLWGHIELRRAMDDQAAGARLRELSASVEAPAMGVEQAAQSFLAHLREAAVAGVLTGFVHVDSIADPYTTVVVGNARISENRFDVEVHGYYWAVMLTAGHIAQLGGTDRVRRQAPCTSVEAITVGAEEALLCVLTESPLDLDEERVVAWRDYLAPLLRVGYPGEWEGIGQKSSPLQRPVWIYEGAPVPRFTRLVLEHLEPDTDVLPVVWAETPSDPEEPTLWIYPAIAFDSDNHLELVRAVVRAWSASGAHGRLLGTDGRVGHVSGVTWDTDDQGAPALAFQADFATANPHVAVHRLATALTEVDKVLGGRALERLKVAAGVLI